jgi:hypothetical protein
MKNALGRLWDDPRDFAAPYPPASKGEIVSRQERRRRYESARHEATERRAEVAGLEAER